MNYSNICHCYGGSCLHLHKFAYISVIFVQLVHSILASLLLLSREQENYLVE